MVSVFHGDGTLRQQNTPELKMGAPRGVTVEGEGTEALIPYQIRPNGFDQVMDCVSMSERETLIKLTRMNMI